MTLLRRGVSGEVATPRQAQKAIGAQLDALQLAVTTDDLMSTPEARAAAAYWEAWSSLPIQFVRADLSSIPEHWKTFGPRRSPLSGSPRLAFNPANAILNYLYRLLEVETRLALLAVGLDPGLGFFHRDKRGRDNLVVDVMEACRPVVDDYVLRLFETQPFRAADFHETRTGVCRLLAPVSHRLAETSPIWARAVAPVAEGVARKLGKPRRIREEGSPTPLTNRNRSRRADKVGSDPPPIYVTGSRCCWECGQETSSRRRRFCDECLQTTHGTDPKLQRARAMVRHQAAIADWRASGTPRDPQVFRQDILPSLRSCSVDQIMEATGYSESYAFRIRRGDVVPHPRVWDALSLLGDSPLA
jgi:CRISPR associated protein Cas1